MTENAIRLNLARQHLRTLVETYALTSEQRAAVNIFSQARGGVGTRGYGKNALGYEIAWWVHPQRYLKEMEFLLSHLTLSSTERILSIGCGPAFHELALALTFPDVNFLATDLDEREIETAKAISDHIGCPQNLQFQVGDALSVLSATDRHPYSHVISFAALHDFPHLDRTLEKVALHLMPNGLFILTYNPFRLHDNFAAASCLSDLLDRWFIVEKEVVLVTEVDSAAFYGEIARLSQEKRGYPLVWNGIVSRRSY
jgi:SAM-dependent methyltransferase